ncbi:unnamed protein product [Pieris brassicae]|uniref:Uncharacterized protein n=1 Tax=Pieris brassicae TaxID=7116 RepID=A0A9P0SCY3_PIEBR|nr:unnamed protein product [Pieris brassicae]
MLRTPATLRKDSLPNVTSYGTSLAGRYSSYARVYRAPEFDELTSSDELFRAPRFPPSNFLYDIVFYCDFCAVGE